MQSQQAKHSYLTLYTNFSDAKAGCYVTFYVKTCFHHNGILIPSVKSWGNLILAPDTTHCYFALDKNSVSKEVNVEGASVTGQVGLVKKSTKELTELVITTNLSLIDVNQSLYTKVITILPKYVIINNTNEKLLVTQQGLCDDFTIIDSRSRDNFRWLNYNGTKKIMLKVLDSNAEDPINEWHWSSPINLEEVGSNNVRCASQKKTNDFLYWKIERKIQNEIIFITIDKEDEKHPMYLIENKSDFISLVYKQEKGEILEFCNSYESNRFAWDNLYESHKLRVEIFIANTNNQLCVKTIKLDEIGQNGEIKYKLYGTDGNEEISYLYYATCTDGYTKKLIFDDRKIVTKDKENEDHTPELMLNLELGGLGISLVCDANNQTTDIRHEIMFCSLVDIQGICIEFKNERRLQLRIGVMQMDNQVALDTPFPVTLYNESIKIEKDKKDIKPFFNLNMVMSKEVPEVMYFKKIEFLIQKIILQCDDELVLNFKYFSDVIMKNLDTTFIGISEIFVESNENEESFDRSTITNELKSIIKGQIVKIPDWKSEQIEKSKQQIYIKNYSSSPLSLKISFYSTMKIESDASFNGVLKRFGLALNTIEGAPVKINALQLQDVVGTSTDIAYILRERYIGMLKRNMLSILGASSLIGNPIQLVNNVGSGVKDFFYKPIEGLVEGPIEGGKGLVKGTSSLFKHTVQGTFGSTSSIFSSLSKGVLVLANDKDYIKERESNNHRERPSNVLQGFGYGIKSAAKSFGSGITGLVKMPVSGAKKKGFTGFLTGTVKGVTGLVAKPISGTFDLVSKTSEGIKNNTKIFEDGKGRGKERIRLPRVFYTKERLFKEFNDLHAFSQSYLLKHKKLSVSDSFVDALVVNKEPIQILVLCETKILKIHTTKDRVTLSVPIKCVKKIEKAPKMIVLWIVDGSYKTSKVKIDIEADSIQDKVYMLFMEMFK